MTFSSSVMMVLANTGPNLLVKNRIAVFNCPFRSSKRDWALVYHCSNCVILRNKFIKWVLSSPSLVMLHCIVTRLWTVKGRPNSIQTSLQIYTKSDKKFWFLKAFCMVEIYISFHLLYNLNEFVDVFDARKTILLFWWKRSIRKKISEFFQLTGVKTDSDLWKTTVWRNRVLLANLHDKNNICKQITSQSFPIEICPRGVWV